MTTRDAYPLLRIDETLETVRGDQRFSALDLHVCYRQVELAPEDMDKSALVTGQGPDKDSSDVCRSDLQTSPAHSRG